jgi:succinyl-CoA synthetase beta subunit
LNLHEHQSKDLFHRYGIPTPRGIVATTPEEAEAAARQLGTPVVAVKSQVLTGGRGKAGGVKIARSPEQAREHAQAILGMNIKGHTVHKVLIDPGADIKQEIYLAVTNDRSAKKPLMMASMAGGMDIEQVNKETPEKIAREYIDPELGLKQYQVYNVAVAMGLPHEYWNKFVDIAMKLYTVFTANDATLVEVNPLVITGSGEMMALDGKVSIDDSALYRHPDLEALRDLQAEPAEETKAREADLGYIKLDGNIGCMVNGAGLAMTTMDIITDAAERLGAKETGPANFLDTGGGAKADKVAAALRIMLSDPKVEAVLFNIFGGITRGDEVAKGLIMAYNEVKPSIPMVIRLAGTNAEEGRRIIEEANIPTMQTASTLMEAAEKAVRATVK